MRAAWSTPPITARSQTTRSSRRSSCRNAPCSSGTAVHERGRATSDARARLYRSTKFYDHSEGLSCCFRQWRADHSHCRLLHGYALAFRFVFATRDLDDRHWCFDFGGLKPVRQWLHEMFDHTLVVAADDPERGRFEALGAAGLADVRVLRRSAARRRRASFTST